MRTSSTSRGTRPSGFGEPDESESRRRGCLLRSALLGGRVMRLPRLLACACVLGALAVPLPAQNQAPDVASALRFRLVGPFRGGRTITATGVPGQPNRFYFG